MQYVVVPRQFTALLLTVSAVSIGYIEINGTLLSRPVLTAARIIVGSLLACSLGRDKAQ
jgi:hypothetical protein